jgi:hypothetical protein
MPNRMMSFAVLLFSFAVALLSFQPKAGTPTVSYNRELHVPVVTLPVQNYWALGAIVIAASLFFIVVAFRGKWHRRVEDFVDKRASYPVFLIFWLLYVVTWLKGVVAILSISPPHWVVYLVLYFGFALIWVIPVLFVKGWFELRKNPSQNIYLQSGFTIMITREKNKWKAVGV